MTQDQQARAPLPHGTVDTHVHVFTPRTHPYDPQRSYSPGPASVDDLLVAGDRQGAERFVLVQPSVYGTDNSAVLDGARQLGPDRARVVGVVHDAAQADALLDQAEGLLMGLRLNVRHDPAGRSDLADDLGALVTVARPRGLFVQVFCGAAHLDAVHRAATTAEVPVVLDHFGGIRSGGPDSASQVMRQARQVAALLRDCDNAWVKLSAPYRVLGPGEPLQVLDPVVGMYAEAASDRLVWASDWPHTGGDKDRAARPVDAVEPFRPVDDLAQDRWLADLLASHGLLEAVMVTNPSRLLQWPA